MAKTTKPAEASATKKDAAEKIDKAVDETSSAVKSSVESVKSGAADIAETARDTAEATADKVAEHASRASETLRGAAASLRDGSFQERSFGQLAASLADASDAIRDKDLGQLSRDVSDFARRNPLLFAGGAALVGFAIARMMTKPGDKS
ncbi:hypothetical protein GCM10016455_04890 [Aliiroseovarius zhejiangensis]|uniref:DUF883 domain-containing protein n=1 Tax=Aliiroseovarius zhejiangensis TaxID=1632025 RepID=A0ABQ3IME2_9RHOB|nr:hypothetical protein [Aliiroseovarius zhejiangensis]GHE87919.1 hypothetical protein GCM10016455_04890 [Aliiroseovarius zhejiangensis]